MPYVLRLATPATRTLVVEALRSAADQRTRVAKGAARKVAEAKADNRDVRSQSVKVTMLLAEADELTELAAALEDATEVAVLDVDQAGRLTTEPITVGVGYDLRRDYEADDTKDTPPSDVDTDPDGDDDGTSPEAQRLAAMAGLTPAVEDPVTGAIPEDEPDDADIEDVQL